MNDFLVAILGSGKSGTSALFHCVRGTLENHLQRPLPGLFEPRTVSELDKFKHSSGVIKAMLPRFNLLAEHPLSARLTHRIFVFRDPRDNIVSFILWRFATRFPTASESARTKALELFARKQETPDSVSLLELIECCRDLTGGGGFWPNGVEGNAFMAADFLSQPHAREWFTLRYEDFVDRRLDALSHYLGVPIDTAALYNKQALKVKRTAAYGDWVNWFTPADHEYFVAKNEARMALLGFDAAPYTGPKHIKPEHCLDYVKRLNPQAFIGTGVEKVA
jgi:hypothetical protein